MSGSRAVPLSSHAPAPAPPSRPRPSAILPGMSSGTSEPSEPGSLLVTGARVVALTGPAPVGEVDVRVIRGVVVEVGPQLRSRGEPVLAADGRWLTPGLWDHHVHLDQWALARQRLDLGGAGSVQEALRLVADHVAALARAGADPDSVIEGWGHRSALWADAPTVAALDAVSGRHAVVLVSGDGHHAWLSSAGLARLGLPARAGVVSEREWFDAYPRLALASGTAPGSTSVETAVAAAVSDASRRGVVGLVDLEFDQNLSTWPARVASGVDRLRVRASCYPHRLDAALSSGLRSGDPLPGGRGLVTMGPLKVISDGSLNTRTAACHAPYPPFPGMEHPHGVQNYTAGELTGLLDQATRSGLEVAVHAIGDAALTVALDAVETTGARGSIEHLQLVAWEDLPRLAGLGLRASVQPAHLLDDRDVTMATWPDRAERCFAFASMARAGVTLALGSDAPVAALDPWLAMAAAVHRSADEREPWNASQALSPQQALAASTDGQGTVGVGSRGDLLLLDDDPLGPADGTADAARRLRSMTCSATVLDGRLLPR